MQRISFGLRGGGSQVDRARYGHPIKHNPMRGQVNRFGRTGQNFLILFHSLQLHNPDLASHMVVWDGNGSGYVMGIAADDAREPWC